MNIAIYRANSFVPISAQEEVIKAFTASHGIVLQDYFLDFSPNSASLENREELKQYIENLKENSRIIVYDFWVLSGKVGEIIKLFTCFFKKDIELINCEKDVVISKNSPSLLSMGLLNDFRNRNLEESKTQKSGRPKGSISKSKFDKFRDEILRGLKEGDSISKIARDLKVNRSSLKDYIYARSLKDMAVSKTVLKQSLEEGGMSNDMFINSIKCPLKESKTKE